MAKRSDKKEPRSLAELEKQDIGIYPKDSPRKGGIVVVERQAPLPPPEEMQDYENIKEGFAERIMVTAEENAQHRRKIESRNQIFSFFLVLCCLGLVGYSLYKEGSIIFPTFTVLALIAGLYAHMIKSKKD